MPDYSIVVIVTIVSVVSVGLLALATYAVDKSADRHDRMEDQ
jgi:hypothetical protein